MTNFNWFSSNFSKARREINTQHTPSGKQALAVAASLLIITGLATVGCSKSKEPTRVASSSSSDLSGSMPSGASTTGSASTPALAEKVPVKKVLKKRPSTVTYKDVASGVSFQYPRKYVLKTGEGAKLQWSGLGPVPMNFVDGGGVAIAAVEMPRGAYPGTDFASAFFNISVNRTLSADACSKFSLSDASHPDEAATATKVKVGDKELDQVQAFGGEAIKQADAKYYHLYENGACYEFALGLSTAGYGVEEGIEPVDRAQVFSKLEKILATVKLQPVSEKEIVVARSGEPGTKDDATGAVPATSKPDALVKTSGATGKGLSAENPTVPEVPRPTQTSESVQK
jgi:hypothetical protein